MNRMQELLVLCVSFIIKQGKKCSNNLGVCYYSKTDKETGENLGCAARPLFDEEVLATDPSIPGSINAFFGPHADEDRKNFIKDEYKNLTQKEVDFVREIQIVHDSYEKPDSCFDSSITIEQLDEFREYCIHNYKKLGESFKLDTAFIDTL